MDGDLISVVNRLQNSTLIVLILSVIVGEKSEDGEGKRGQNECRSTLKAETAKALVATYEPLSVRRGQYDID